MEKGIKEQPPFKIDIGSIFIVLMIFQIMRMPDIVALEHMFAWTGEVRGFWVRYFILYVLALAFKF
ncbi:hypothetical protein HanHA300_Chr02g0058911 [Helianthus annuus]|nr:hypothetical protein HanHA300_Chr02g0058911 [Helianthus annuus]KAJ0619098.1 hypothetical protein HanHA89_Chr02g0067481 [Helianthus annuus]KAJ0777547.1 hypothetical protein HanLR1_Chr02g0061681 [Helianthus annuus]KAJ0786580.1 hypothetical protein HanOQP8_Chr02g0072851 [Helianthus annuus]